MPRPRYQIAEEDVAVVYRWMHAKLRDAVWPQPDAALTAWDRFRREHPTAPPLQRWCDQYLDARQWTQLQAVIRAARRGAGQTRSVRLSTSAHARLHDLAEREQLTLSETIERYLSGATVTLPPEDTPHAAEKTPPKPNATGMAAQHPGRAGGVPRKQGVAFITSRKGVCYLTIKIRRHNCSLMRIRHYTIEAQDKRDMRRLHPDIDFDWKKIAHQLAEKREVCRQYRSRRRRARRPRLSHEPFYGVVDPLGRTVYVNHPTNTTGVGALLDRLMADERLRGADILADGR